MQYATRRIATNHQDIRLEAEPLLCLPAPDAQRHAQAHGPSNELADADDAGSAPLHEPLAHEQSLLEAALTPEMLARQKRLPLVSAPEAPEAPEPGSGGSLSPAISELEPESASAVTTETRAKPFQAGFASGIRAWLVRGYRALKRRWRRWFGLDN